MHTSVETVFDSFKIDTEAQLATLEVQFYMDVRICNHKLSVAVTTYVQTKSIPIQRSRIKWVLVEKGFKAPNLLCLCMLQLSNV